MQTTKHGPTALNGDTNLEHDRDAPAIVKAGGESPGLAGTTFQECGVVPVAYEIRQVPVIPGRPSKLVTERARERGKEIQKER